MALLIVSYDYEDSSCYIAQNYSHSTTYVSLQKITWPKNFDFGQVLFSSTCMCLCLCVSVCTRLPQLSQKVFDRF